MVSLLPALPQEDRQEIGRTRLVRTEGKREAASTKKAPERFARGFVACIFYPLTPEIATDSIICFWNTRNMMSIGSKATKDAAIMSG